LVDVAETLFPFVDPIGKTLMVDDRPSRSSVSASSRAPSWGSPDNWVTIPISLHQKNVGLAVDPSYLCESAGSRNIFPAAESEARLTLRTRRHVAYSAKDDFALNTNQNFLQIWATSSQAFFAVTIGIASISLIVGASL